MALRKVPMTVWDATSHGGLAVLGFLFALKCLHIDPGHIIGNVVLAVDVALVAIVVRGAL